MLPTGTVTFLFTDIEGSTKLAQQYRDAWEMLRERHHTILRQAIEAHNGYVFQIVGDAFCAAFSTAEEAVRAAIKVQIDLNAEKWVEGGSLKVRMGIHTGKAKIQENGEYHGYLAMSRVQRLMAVAHGGQILVSLAAQNQVLDDLPANVTLRDMGEHRLKNIIQPEHIYQLIFPGLNADFPQLRTEASFNSAPQLGLTVNLFGRFEIKFDNKTISLSSRIAQSLFAYLILNAGRLHRREKLAGMFWPDATEEKARTYLRHELWLIRKTLASKSKIDYLLADDMNISFNASVDYWLDVRLLDNLKDNSAANEFMAALSVSQGELLPGFYDEWVTHEREHLQAVYEEKMAWLLQLLEKEKRWHEILEWAERWISLGQGPEAAYRYLMIAYDALGDRAKVTSTYQQCVRALHELELEPSEQTRAIAFRRTFKLNIPIPLTSFIGREKELKEVAELLSKSRLVTLTGSGGVGKTRLAIQAVADVFERFPDGVWFVDLAPLSDPTHVPDTLVNLLGLKESGERSVTDLLTTYFRSRTALLIFDNCEHLIESCAQLIHSVLISCEGLVILATSREALQVSGEIPYRVPSLPVPKSDKEFAINDLAKIESVRLFTERAAFVSSGFVFNSQNALDIASICERLDGIPLAIELAAARTNVLSVHQIQKGLDDRFHLLTRGLRPALPRHQTLRAMIEWSYDLLTEKERILFRRLAVFMGGWTLEAAQEVCSGDGIEHNEVLDLLSQLASKSLLFVETVEDGARYRRLETIRQFAREKLFKTSEAAQLQDRHLDYFRVFAQHAKPQLRGAQQLVWLDRLETDLDNFRAALTWAIEGGSVEAGIDLAADLASGGFWSSREHKREGRDFLEKLLTQPQVADQVQVLAKGHLAAAIVFTSPLDLPTAYHHAEQSEALWLQLGQANQAELAEARNWRLFIYVELNYDHLDEDFRIWVRQAYKENLQFFQQAGDLWMSALTYSAIGMELWRSGNFKAARQAYVQCLALFRECGDNISVAVTAYHWGILALEEGKYAEARTQLEESLFIFRQMRVNSDEPLWMLGAIAIREGDYARAKSWYLECLLLDLELGVNTQVAECLIGFAGIANAQKQFERAAQLIGAAEAEIEARQASLENFDQAEFQRLTTVLREELGDAKFEALAAEGRAMTVERAISFALERNNR